MVSKRGPRQELCPQCGGLKNLPMRLEQRPIGPSTRNKAQHYGNHGKPCTNAFHEKVK